MSRHTFVNLWTTFLSKRALAAGLLAAGSVISPAVEPAPVKAASGIAAERPAAGNGVISPSLAPLRSFPVQIDPALESPFFHKEVCSLPWYILKHDDGHLEDTLGGDPKDAREIRHTAEVTSDSRGEHAVTHADAWWDGDALTIRVHEFNAAYADDLTLRYDPVKQQFTAQYHSPSPAPGVRTWAVTKGKLVLKAVPAKAEGSILHARVEVWILESDPNGGTMLMRVNGNIKPSIGAPLPP